MHVIVQELATNYTRQGPEGGKQVLVLHGWADDGRGWQVFARSLGRTYDVIVPDLPGFGGTETPRAIWGLDEYSVFVEDFIAKAGLRPHAIVAHSNGGAIALRGIAGGRLRPDKLVLLGSAGIRSEGGRRKRALRLVAKTGKLAAAPLPAVARNRLRRKLYQAAGSEMLIAEHLQETFKRVVSEDVRGDAEYVRVPTLLVYGASDTSTPPRYGELLAGLMPHAKLTVLPGAGHFVHTDAAAAVLQLIKEFLA